MATLTELTTAERRAPTISVMAGHALLLLILVAAAVLRFGYLDALPLQADEAQQALIAWQPWQVSGISLATASASPAYFLFTTVVFAFFGASDAAARMAPAIFGMITVLLPWLWRKRLGTGGALAVSALLAVSPTANLASTSAGGDAMALASTLLLFIAWMRVRDGDKVAWFLVAAAALGFGLATTTLFYGGLLTLAAAWLMQRALRVSGSAIPGADGQGIPPALWRRALVLLLVTFVMTTTFLGWRSIGLGQAADIFADWLGQFGLRGGLQALALPLLALGRYELIVVTLGAGAIFWASWHGDDIPLFLVYWFAAGLVLTLLQWGILSNTLLLVLPSYLLLGFWLHDALKTRASDIRWLLMLALLSLGAIAYFNGARYLRVMTTAPQQLSFLFLAFVAIVSGLVAVNFVRSWDRAAAYQGALVGLLALFFIFNWGTSRWMQESGANDPREPWVGTSTDDDLPMLAQMLEEISWQSTGSARDLNVLSAVDTFALRWYLREFPNVVFGLTVPPGSTQQAILAAADEDVPAPGDDYMGTDLGLEHVGATLPLGAPLTLSDTLRWWIFHEHPAQLTNERMILWVRSDTLLR